MRNQNFNKVSLFLEEIITGKLKQRGFIYHTLFTKWNQIIGDDISAVTAPVEMNFFDKKGRGAVLTVMINSALAPEIQLQTENILQRINQFYGFTAVRKIKFYINHGLDLLGEVKNQKNQKIEDISLEININDLDKKERFPIRTSDPELKTLLENLQRNWFYRVHKYKKNR